MAGVNLQVTIEGEKQVSRRLLILVDGVTNYTEPLYKINGELHKTFQMNFSQRGSLFGGWAPRKPQFRQGVRVDTWPLLQKTGGMRKSFRSTLGSEELVIRNVSPHFKYHQSNKPRRRLPRRVMMKIDKERKDFIVKAFQEYLVSLTRR